jgi:hypothetical protein
MHRIPSLTAAAVLFGGAFAQYFPPTPKNITVIKSKFADSVEISYKEVGFHRLTNVAYD